MKNITIIEFNAYSHSNQGIMDVTTIKTNKEINNYDDFINYNEVEDYIIISKSKWETDNDNNEFMSDTDRIKEAKERASYTDLILAKNIIVK